MSWTSLPEESGFIPPGPPGSTQMPLGVVLQRDGDQRLYPLVPIPTGGGRLWGSRFPDFQVVLVLRATPVPAARLPRGRLWQPEAGGHFPAQPVAKLRGALWCLLPAISPTSVCAFSESRLSFLFTMYPKSPAQSLTDSSSINKYYNAKRT